MFNVVVVGADDSITAQRAVEAATEIALLSGGELHIVSAFDSTPFAINGLPDEFKQVNSASDVDALLQVLSFIARKRGLEVSSRWSTP